MLNDLFQWETRAIVEDIIEPWKPVALNHDNWPPNYAAVYAWRFKTLEKLNNDKEFLASAKAYYSTHKKEFIMHWMDTYDPRKHGVKWMPFVLFQRQAEFIDFLESITIDQQSGLVEKARDMGITWLSCAYSTACWIFNQNDAIGWGSRKETLVDKLGDPDSIFEKLRLLIDRLPAVFKPIGLNPTKHLTFMKCINPENNSTITGESGDNIGRGGRKRIYFKDEAQPLNAKILTPFGWSTMGEMVVGSDVIGSEGKSIKVVGINDCGIAPIYQVTFSDGTFTECSENHLWTVERKIGKKQIEVLRTIELIDKIKYQSPNGQKQFRYRIPVVKPINFSNDKILPLDPWITGALIGDGSVGNGCIKFTSGDPENIIRFLERCPDGTNLKFDKNYNWRFIDSGNRYNKSSRAKNAVISAGIYGCRSYEKFIPDIYKFSSVKNRIELLRGLMDTDGSASGGVASFHTCSERLANDVRFIVQSLGGTATINIKKDHRGYRDIFVIHMVIPNMIPFHLLRKKMQLRNRINSVDKTIVNIEYIRDDIVRCITVNSENGLYVTDSCILTHNSAHYERPEKIEAALGDNTRIQVDISSVNGLNNPFHRRRETGIEWSADAQIPPGFTRIFVVDWSDHPEKTQEWHDERKAKFEREGMAHIFAQEVERSYTASIPNVIIPYEYIEAAVDAHLRIPCLMKQPHDIPDTWMAGLDVADGGIDRNALAKRQWVILRSVEEWGERDPGVTTRRAIDGIRNIKQIRVMYDAIGLGVSVKSEYNRLSIDEKMDLPKFVAWNAGDSVLEPYNRIIPNDEDSLTNKDFYANLKAQAWFSIYTRFYKTWRCIQSINENKPIPNYDAEELISLDSTIPLLDKLKKELSQAVRGQSSGLRTIVDKTPEGTKSPNLADSVVMAYFPIPDDYGSVIVGR